MNNLIGPDIELMRCRYDEALALQGVPATYQYPNMASSNVHGESVVDSYSSMIDTHIILDNNPKVKTFRRYGWVVANDENLPFLLHCSFHLPHLQKDSIFRIAGQYAEIPDSIFRVTELTYSLQAPDHIICQVVPVYESQLVGKTDVEIKQENSTSNRFIKQNVDYRGEPYKVKEDM